MQPCGAGLSRPLCAQGPQTKQEAEKLDPEPQLLYRRLLIQTSGETLIQPEFHLGNPHCSHVPGAVVLLEIRVWWDGEALPGLGGWCALELTHTELHSGLGASLDVSLQQESCFRLDSHLAVKQQSLP